MSDQHEGGEEKKPVPEQGKPQQAPQSSQDLQGVQLITGYVKDSGESLGEVFRNGDDS